MGADYNNGLISILIPTYNEAENISEVVQRIIRVLDGTRIEYEILVIDDASLDNTAEVAQRELGKKGRVIRRVSDKKSLSLSVVDGIRQAKGNIIVVMDADGSHSPELIPEFVKAVGDGYDLVVGSRYIKGGGTENFPFQRKIISKVACFLGRAVTDIKDNTSGFFCIRKKVLDSIELTPFGFKIGLEIFARANLNNNYKEIPCIFTNRKRGQSKLKIMPIVQYLHQLLGLFIYKKLMAKR